MSKKFVRLIGGARVWEATTFEGKNARHDRRKKKRKNTVSDGERVLALKAFNAAQGRSLTQGDTTGSLLGGRPDSAGTLLGG